MVIIENYRLLYNQPLAIAARYLRILRTGTAGDAAGLPSLRPAAGDTGAGMRPLSAIPAAVVEPAGRNRLSATAGRPGSPPQIQRGSTLPVHWHGCAAPGAGGLPRRGMSEAGSAAQCPLYRYRQWRRGFNQRILSPFRWQMAALPFMMFGLIRTRATLSQRMLSRTQRLTNLSSAFAVTP